MNSPGWVHFTAFLPQWLVSSILSCTDNLPPSSAHPAYVYGFPTQVATAGDMEAECIAPSPRLLCRGTPCPTPFRWPGFASLFSPSPSCWSPTHTTDRRALGGKPEEKTHSLYLPRSWHALHFYWLLGEFSVFLSLSQHQKKGKFPCILSPHKTRKKSSGLPQTGCSAAQTHSCDPAHPATYHVTQLDTLQLATA